MHYEKDQFALFTHSKQTEGKQMRGLKTEVYDCPEHQKVVLWENKSTVHIHVIYLQIKLRHDIVQAIACLKGYKVQKQNFLISQAVYS